MTVSLVTLLGLGCDLLRIERIAGIGIWHGKHLLDRVLAPAKRAVLAGCSDTAADWRACAPRIARCIVGKEAFFKALGIDLVVPLRWVDVAVGATIGEPAITLDGAAAAAFVALGSWHAAWRCAAATPSSTPPSSCSAGPRSWPISNRPSRNV